MTRLLAPERAVGRMLLLWRTGSADDRRAADRRWTAPLLPHPHSTASWHPGHAETASKHLGCPPYSCSRPCSVSRSAGLRSVFVGLRHHAQCLTAGPPVHRHQPSLFPDQSLAHWSPSSSSPAYPFASVSPCWSSRSALVGFRHSILRVSLLAAQLAVIGHRHFTLSFSPPGHPQLVIAVRHPSA